MSDISHIEKLIDIYGRLPTEANKRRIMQLVDKLGDSRELQGRITTLKELYVVLDDETARNEYVFKLQNAIEDKIHELESQKEKTQ